MSYLGTNKIGKMYLGSTAIGKAYLGNNLVFQQGGAQPVMIPYIRGGADGSYIDTGITPDNTTKVIVWARNVQPASGWLFGGRTAIGQEQLGCWLGTNTLTGSFRSYFGSGTFDANDQFVNMGHYKKYEWDSGSFKVDGVTQATGSTSTFSSSYPIHLFGINTAGTHSSPSLPIDICACQIYKNDVLVRDFTAVNTPSAGLYDAVSQTLFTNAGSGSFTYGTFDKNAYTPLEYIECDGNQYFDSAVPGGYSTPIVAKVASNASTPKWNIPVSARYSTSLRCEFVFGNLQSANSRIYAGYVSALQNISISSFKNVNLVLIKNNNVFSVYKNNAQLGSSYNGSTSTSFTTGQTFIVGGTFEEGVFSPVQAFEGPIYFVGLGEKSFVPAKQGSKIGMYDTYNDVFYKSATEMPFIAGPEI